MSPLSRSLGQLGAIAQGIYPPVRIVATPENKQAAALMRSLKTQLHVIVVVLPLSLVAAATFAWLWLRCRQEIRGASPSPAHARRIDQPGCV
jgi:hypothetical protein